MSLLVSCECGLKTSVTPAKCGNNIRCLCGQQVLVPSLSKLQSLMAMQPHPTSPSARQEAEIVLRPVRPIPAAFALLFMIYGLYQLVCLPRRLSVGPQVAGFALALTAGAFAASIALYQYSRRPE